MGLEGFIASGAFGLIFALAVILGVPVIRTFGPIMVVSRNTARVGFLFVGGIVPLVVVVSLAIGIGVIRSIRTSPSALIALILSC